MNKPKVGDQIEILEAQYCGIEFARIGDKATVIEIGPIASAFWVTFDVGFKQSSMVLWEHNGTGWKLVKKQVAC